MSAVFIVTLAVLFFVAVKTVYRDFKLAAENYFEENVLDDLVVFTFTDGTMGRSTTLYAVDIDGNIILKSIKINGLTNLFSEILLKTHRRIWSILIQLLTVSKEIHQPSTRPLPLNRPQAKCAL